MHDLSFPGPLSELRSNAWCGEAASGALSDTSIGWGSRRSLPEPGRKLGPKPPDQADWKDPRVAWGVVVPDRDDVPSTDKAAGADLPEPIRELIARRGGAPILRYRGNLKGGLVRRYAADGAPSDPSLRGLRGIAPNAVPRYLVIVGSPAEIPWRTQYRLQADAYVGRLDLDAHGLERYVEALLGDWASAEITSSQPVVWATDHGHRDITHLMRKTIAERLAQALATDPEGEFQMEGGVLAGAQATHAALIDTLAQRHPAFVMTSSHGATYPLDDPPALSTRLGLPMDAAHSPLDVPALTAAWQPHGVIWYSHACCSAGSDAPSSFAGAVEPNSKVGRTLNAVADLGACSAPFPRRLLGGEKPARAFVGHVEPTFDWTLRDPVNGQVTTAAIIDAFYNSLHLGSRPPIGLALAQYYRAVSGLLQDYAEAVDDVDQHVVDAKNRARYLKLIATDLLSMVLLGDPTVRLSDPA